MSPHRNDRFRADFQAGMRVSEDEQADLAAFDARLVAGAEVAPRITQPGALVGTPAYMAPRLPFAGALVQKLVLSRFARVLGLLLASGVPVIRALEITGEAVVNRAYRATLAEARVELVEGGKLSASLAKSSIFPPLLIHMIAVGEKSGTLEGMLEKSGSAYEREFEASVGRFLALLEPLLVLAMGLAVGLVVVAVLLPIFQLNQLVK